MTDLLAVILPVFLVIGSGYLAAWRRYFSETATQGLMRFAQNVAIPCLLFSAIAGLDLGPSFDPALLASFYLGALSGFAAGLLGARYLFSRDWEDSIAIGFCGLFSNSVLLGLPIMERAYGAEALTYNYAIVAIHAPFCYAIGITAMELVRARGQSARALPGKVLGAMFRNAIIVGIAVGFVVNLGGFALPVALQDAVDLIARAALPAALFGLGCVLYQYRPEGDLRVIVFIVAVTLIVHPLVTWGLASYWDLDTEQLRAAIVTAAMAPGINAYIFANMYGRARRVAASAVLIATAVSIVTATFWLAALP